MDSFERDFGDYIVNFVTFHPDMDQTPLLKGLPDDRCQCPHWGYVVTGSLTYRFADHEETVHAGEAFYLPPGHVPVGNAPDSVIVQFSPSSARPRRCSSRTCRPWSRRHGDHCLSVPFGMCLDATINAREHFRQDARM